MSAITFPPQTTRRYNPGRIVATTRPARRRKPMSPDDPVTQWVNQLKDGDREAVRPLLERYFQQLVRLAGGRLRNASRLADGAEDVALSAFDSFCRAAEQGRLPKLTDRDSLWA